MLALRDLPVKFVYIGKCFLHLGHGFLQLRDLFRLFLFLLGACSDQVISDFCAVFNVYLPEPLFQVIIVVRIIVAHNW